MVRSIGFSICTVGFSISCYIHSICFSICCSMFRSIGFSICTVGFSISCSISSTGCDSLKLCCESLVGRLCGVCLTSYINYFKYPSFHVWHLEMYVWGLREMTCIRCIWTCWLIYCFSSIQKVCCHTVYNTLSILHTQFIQIVYFHLSFPSAITMANPSQRLSCCRILFHFFQTIGS